MIFFAFCSANHGRKCWTTQAYNQRFSRLPIVNVDPHYSGTDTTVERNMETMGGEGDSILRQEFGISILSHNGQKFCKRMNGGN